MAYKVKIDSFEGPFDLLLYLVSRNKVDIGSVPIAQIADQYLHEVSKMNDLDLDIASDFLLVAATLLELKAQALLPSKKEDVDEELAELSPAEARDMLIERLVAYKQFKNAADSLNVRYVTEGRMHARPFGPDESFLELLPDFLEGVTLDRLSMMAANAMAKKDVFLLESEHIAAKPIPVEVHVRSIHERIKNEKHLDFSQLVGKDAKASIVVVTFLAVLELYKRQMVYLHQSDAFGDISIDYIEGSGELLLTGNDELTSVGGDS